MTAPDSTPGGPDPTGSGPSGVPHPRTPGDHAPPGPPRPPVPGYPPGPGAYPPGPGTYLPGPRAYPPGPGAYPPPGWVVHEPPVRLAPGGAPVADFGSRLAAYLLDTLVMVPAVLAIELVAVGLGFVLVRPLTDPPRTGQVVLFGVIAGVVTLVGALAVQYWYFVVYQVRHGQTVGRRTLKIKVVSVVDGSPMTRRQAVRRWLVQYLGGALAPYFSWVDGLWQLGDEPYRQCLHDLCAETVVVRHAPVDARSEFADPAARAREAQ